MGASHNTTDGRTHHTLTLWRMIFGDAEGYIGLFSGLRVEGENDLQGIKNRYLRYPLDAERALDWCLAESEAGREVYFCVHILTEPRRIKQNAVPVRALWADGDYAEVTEGVPEPSVVVESSPGRTHLFWLLTEPIEPEVAERLNNRIARAIGADRSGHDLTQLLRPPGTRNQKYDGTPEVSLVETTGEVYDHAHLERLLPQLPEDATHDRLGEPVSPPMEDEEILERCRQAKNAEKFAALWAGDTSGYDGDDSRADQALVSLLAFFTQDREQIDRLFRESGLVREKWISRPDYRERTLRFALRKDRDYFGVEHENGRVVLIDDLDGGDLTSEDEEARDTGDTYDTMTPRVAPLRHRGGGTGSFPVHAFPPVLRRYLEEAAHAKEAPVEFIASPMLAALGVGIGASRRFRIERSWTELPTLYTAVVALPASGKSPAEDAAMLPVYRQSKVLNHRYKIALETWKVEHQRWEQEAAEARKKKKRVPEEPEKPVKQRIRVGDTTVEALHVRMAENPRGLVLARDELAGFFNSLNQYKGKGSDRQFWLSQHSGRVAPVDRKTDDETYDVDYPCVFVVGSIQPEKLHVLDLEAGDGMVERFLFAWPEARMQPDSERDISVGAEEGYVEIWNRLYALKMGEDEFGNPAPIDVPLASEALPAWRAYRRAIKRGADEPGVSSFMRGVIGKMKAHFHRFALILALVRTVEDREAVEEVREEDLDNAWQLVEYFTGQSYRLYTEFKKENKDDLLAYALSRFLEKTGGEWEGTATELFDALKELDFGKALPKTPDALTQAVRKAARNSPALTAEKGQRSAEARSIVLRREHPEGVRDGVGAEEG